MKQKRQQHKMAGISILSSLITIGVIGVIALTSASILVNSKRNSGQTRNKDNARYIAKYVAESLHCCNTLKPHLANLGTKFCNGIDGTTSIHGTELSPGLNMWWYPETPQHPGDPDKFSLEPRDYNDNLILGPAQDNDAVSPHRHGFMLPQIDGDNSGEWSVYVKCNGLLATEGGGPTQRYLSIEVSSETENVQKKRVGDKIRPDAGDDDEDFQSVPFEITEYKLCGAVFNEPSVMCTTPRP